MSIIGKGYLRGQQATQPATEAGREIKAQGNPLAAKPGETAAVPHDSSSGIDKAARSLKPLPASSHGGLTPITQGPASAKPPQPAK